MDFSRVQTWLQADIRRDIVLSLVLKTSYAGLMFLLTLLLARVLGPEGYGVYAYGLSIAMILVLLAKGGMPGLVMRETASGISLKDFGGVKGMWVIGCGVVLTLSMGIYISVSFAFYKLISLPSEVVHVIHWGLILVPLLALGEYFAGILRGLHQVVKAQLIESYLRIAIFLVLISIYWYTEFSLLPVVAMKLHVASGIFALCLGVYFLIKSVPTEIFSGKPRFRLRKWVSSAIPLLLLGGIGMLNTQMDVLMLGWFQPMNQVGLYRVAFQMALFASLGLQAVNMVVAPRFAQLHAEQEKNMLEKLVVSSGRVVFTFNGIITLLFLLSGGYLLVLFFGEPYARSYVPMIILLGGQIVNSVVGSVGFLLNMTGYERITAAGMSISLIVNVLLNLLLIPNLGMIGAAIATSISMGVWNVYLWYMVYHKLGINSFVFVKMKSYD